MVCSPLLVTCTVFRGLPLRRRSISACFRRWTCCRKYVRQRRGGLERAPIRVTSFSAQLESVRRGMGVAVLPRILAKDLIELFVDLPLPDLEVYMVTRPQALKQPHIKCFFSILEEMLHQALSTDSGQDLAQQHTG